MDLIDIFSTFHCKIVEDIFFSSNAHATFSSIDRIVSHKSSVIKCQKTEIISNIFSDTDAMRLDISYTHTHTHTHIHKCKKTPQTHGGCTTHL